MVTPIAFARMEPFKKYASGCMRDKLDYIGRKGRYADRKDLIAGPRTILPADAPARFRDARQLWSAAEDKERAGGLVALELLVALPAEAIMPKAQAVGFCVALAEALAKEHGIAVTFAIHDAAAVDQPDGPAESYSQEAKIAEIDVANRHVHLLLTTRQLSQNGFARRRYEALLPSIVGRSLSRSAALSRVHVADAVNFQLWVRRLLERHLARSGTSVRPRLDAIHRAHHVGPVAATRALINDVEALVRRPDGAAILRKIQRLRVNSEIEMRNRRDIGTGTALLAHLADRIFRQSEVQALVERYCDSPQEASRIVQSLMEQTLAFSAPASTGSEQFHILPAYRESETRIADLLAKIKARSPKEAVLDGGLIEQLAAGRRVSLIEITDERRADALDTLVEKLQGAGLSVVMACHLNKRRPPPPNVKLLPLHWTEPPTIPKGAFVIVDEADDIRMPQLERLLHAILCNDAQLLFCRRAYRQDFVPHPLLSAIFPVAQETYGPAATNHAAPFNLVPGQTVLFLEDIKGVVEIAAQSNTESLKRGKSVFFLSGDPRVTQLLIEKARQTHRPIQVGRSVPADWQGPVVVLCAGIACDVAHLRSLAPLRPQFIVAQTNALDIAEFATQLRRGAGQLSTLTDPIVPVVAAGPPNTASQATGKFPERGSPLSDLEYDLSSSSLPELTDDDTRPDELGSWDVPEAAWGDPDLYLASDFWEDGPDLMEFEESSDATIDILCDDDAPP